MDLRNTSILDIVAEYKETEDIFRAYDDLAGKCVLCHYLFDSPSQLAEKLAIDEDELIGKLEKSIK